MHSPLLHTQGVWPLWQQWSRIIRERMALELEIERRRALIEQPSVPCGRFILRDVAALRELGAPGWARTDEGAMARHKARIARLEGQLQAAQRKAAQQRLALGLSALEARAKDLDESAQGLANAIGKAPVARIADVLARLDMLACMWGPEGDIGEPAAPLPAILDLAETLARHVPDYTPTWTQRQALAHSAD